MKKLAIYFSMLIFAISCKNNNSNDNISSRMIDIKGMDGKPEYLYFVNAEEGYSFNTIEIVKEPTTEQLNDPNYLVQSNYESIIYKTIDGGNNWTKVFTLADFSFYNIACIEKENVLIQIINTKESLNNKLLKFNLKSLESSVLKFNFERMGQIWAVDREIFIDSKNKGISNIYSAPMDFTKIDSISNEKIFKDKVIVLNNIPFVLTWKNELYNIAKKDIININNVKPDCITKKDSNNILLAGKKETSISLLEYNLSTKQIKEIKDFEGYNIVQGLQSNDKVICGFIGNIEGAFTEYDLFYSLDKGKTWNIQKLEEANYIRPSFLIDNILYIYSGGDRLQKIVFQ